MEHQIPALMGRLQSLMSIFQANMAERAKQFQLTATQAAVAQCLGQNSGATLQEVCVHLGWPKSTVSRAVDDLVQRGIAIRQVPANNRRTVELSLDESALGCLPSSFDEVFPGGVPSEAELQGMIETLDRLLEMLGKPSKPGQEAPRLPRMRSTR